MSFNKLFFFLVFLVAFTACKSQKSEKQEMNSSSGANTEHYNASNMPPFFVNSMGDTIKTVIKSDAEWQKELDPQAYNVLRKKGTERPFTSPFLNEKHEGLFTCAACGLPLFRTQEKFDSGTGWPSFWKPADEAVIMKDTDQDLGYTRSEVMCARCGGHLGHVFDDGPKPTGLRYCINGVSLAFVEAKK